MTRVAAMTFAALLVCVPCTAAEHTKDSLEKVRKTLAEKKAVLVDVREPAEWKEGRLEAALLVPLSKLKEEGENQEFAAALEKKLSKKKIVYCHCRSGRRALEAADILAKLGYDVRPLKPGYEDLLKAGFPQAKKKQP